MSVNREHTIHQSWDTNANAWTRAVREGTIESRERATNQAIVNAVMACRPHRVLDVGCGEGWLVRALAARGIDATGVDGSAGLVEAARGAGGGRFIHASYEQLTDSPGQLGGSFDVVVANFALLQEHLTPLLTALGHCLTRNGRLLIQTVHPDALPRPQQEGWREEDFRGFNGCWQAMPWYYRTRDGWQQLLLDSGFGSVTVRETTHPDGGRPLSLILSAPLSS